VRVPGLTGAAGIKIQVFTVAFRKVKEKDVLGQPVGVDAEVELTDDWDKPFASGIYYVVVTTTPLPGSLDHAGRFIGKLLLLR